MFSKRSVSACLALAGSFSALVLPLGKASAAVGTWTLAASGANDGYGSLIEGRRTIDGSRTLTSSTASSSSASYSDDMISGSAWASANLATGRLKAFAESAYRLNTAPPRDESRGEAYLADNLVFLVAGASANTVTSIGINFVFHGTQSTSGADLFYANSEFHLAGAGFNLLRSKNGGEPSSFSYNQANWASFSVSGGGDSYNVSATYNLVGASTTLDMYARLNTITWGNARADFSNTSSISFILPETVRMTSQSGVFLSEAVTQPVPEPSVWAMMISGFGLVGGAMRRAGNRSGKAPAAKRDRGPARSWPEFWSRV